MHAFRPDTTNTLEVYDPVSDSRKRAVLTSTFFPADNVGNSSRGDAQHERREINVAPAPSPPHAHGTPAHWYLARGRSWLIIQKLSNQPRCALTARSPILRVAPMQGCHRAAFTNTTPSLTVGRR